MNKNQKVIRVRVNPIEGFEKALENEMLLNDCGEWIIQSITPLKTINRQLKTLDSDVVTQTREFLVLLNRPDDQTTTVRGDELLYKIKRE